MNKAWVALAGAALIGSAIVYQVVNSSGVETKYRRPGSRAGVQAGAWWDQFWGPESQNSDGSWNSGRCTLLPPGRNDAGMPPGPTNCASSVYCLPHGAPASGSWTPQIYQCPHPNEAKQCYTQLNGNVAIVHPADQAGHTYGYGGAHGVAIVGTDGVEYPLCDQCANQPGNPTPIPTMPPPSPTPTIPAGVTCVYVTVTPQVVCVTATPKVHP